MSQTSWTFFVNSQSLVLLSGGWDFAKGVRRETRFGSLIKLKVLAHLAMLLHLNEKRDFEESVFKLALRDSIPSFADQWDLLLTDLLQDGLLGRVGCSYSFSHHSFQEYFAAQDLNDPSGRKPTRVLKWFLKGK